MKSSTNATGFLNQTAVISGGADGLGKGIAWALAEEGVKIALFDSNEAKLEQTVNELNAAGYRAHGWRVDVADETTLARVFDAAQDMLGGVDILVNSAGIVGPTSVSILDYPIADFDRVCAVNLRGSFLLAKYALPSMVAKQYGRMLFIASIAGKEGNPYMAGYSASKAGVIGLVKGLGKEFATQGITVNGLAPAVIRTAMNEHTAPDQLTYMTQKIPMKRLGTVAEVAAMAKFIVSPQNSFCTGFVFDISGGRATY